MTPGTRRRPARAAPGPGVPGRSQRPPDPFNAPEQHVGGERRRKCVERDSLGPGTASDGVRQKREHGLRRGGGRRSEEHTSELQSHHDLVCRLLLEKKKEKK